MSRKAPTAEEKEKPLEEALAAVRAKVAQIPREELIKISPELEALTGILPRDFDFEKAREEYYDYMAWKHGDRTMEFSEWQNRAAASSDDPGGRRSSSKSESGD